MRADNQLRLLLAMKAAASTTKHHLKLSMPR